MSRRLLSTAVAVVLPLCLASIVEAQPITLRVQGAVGQPNGASGSPAVSADGRVIVFRSNATNLPSGTSGGSLFAMDIGTRVITALTPTANGGSDRASISADGRFIAFETSATNIGDGVNGESSDIIRLDRQDGAFRRASRGLANAAANAGSEAPAISGDGRYVAFTSNASNLVAPAPTGGIEHLYLMDFQTGALTLVDQNAQGAYGNKDVTALETNAMSSDGSRLVFTTQAENLTTVNIGNVGDVLVRTRDPATGAVSFQNVNRSNSGAIGMLSSSRGSISPNGRYVVFRSAAGTITPVPSMSGLYVRDLNANTVVTVALPAGYNTCDRARISDVGDVLMQCAPNAPMTAIQLFVAPLNSSTPRLVTRNIVGVAGNLSSANTFAISADGGVIGFESAANDLIPVDTNNHTDVFLSGDARRLDGFFGDGFE